MNCLHPFKRKVKDPLTGQVTEVLTPCGKCINCLHAYQDMWTIRLSETGRYFKEMIYDTLTLNQFKVRVKIDFNKPTKDGTLYGSTERWRQWKIDAMKKKFSSFQRYYPHISEESYQLLKYNGFKVYDFPKKEVQDWMKRGRQFMFRDKGYRPKIAYFIVQEYGPKSSRPHFHILLFGLNYSDYMHYFGNPWREDFGWTKPVYKQYTAQTMKDYNCIMRYVSKYVSKGVFESPHVKDNLQSKPYRLISKGLGEGYLAKDFFAPFKNPELTKWMDVHKPSEETYERICKELEAAKDYDKLREYQEYYEQCKSAVSVALTSKRTVEFNGINDGSYIDLSGISEEQFDKICVYYDSGGFPHALPQYYKNKLLRNRNEKNIYQLEVQNVLQSRARLHDNKSIQEEAAALGVIIPDEWLDKDSSTWKLPVCTLFMVNYNHLVRQRASAQAKAERRYTRLKNLYNRGKMNLSNPACQ